MEQQFSGVKFRKFGYTWRGCDRVPENRNNRELPLRRGILTRAQFHSARLILLFRFIL